ncbi:MAG: SUMF1/EgtB/PvdO family nonheme iron enzyme [Anaerolineae bacterium]|jgi:eukaryotic-like serine/threonine-protein kinase|nr:SUMF1/EgtB/PvdO family nonheme iron enzyme [Anaerolineae bacterium]
MTTALVGQSLGRYHILEQLGEGGMAVVYKAFDTRLETEVAVKVIRTENILPKALPRTLKRFEREAKALANLTHPNIVKVSDYGEYEGMPYLVMPYLSGGTLKAKMGKAIDWQEAIRLLLPVANALGYAHEKKLIHRDVKPANILLTEKNQPMLSDFGVAKIFDLEETVDLTGTGMGIGTPEYMAPEQWTGKTTAQSDIYALGIVLYEALTGRKPYSADTPAALLLKQANDPLPRPTQFAPNLPKSVERILLKALAKDPANRYCDMGEFALALEDQLQGKTASAKPARKRKKQEKTPRAKRPFPLKTLGTIAAGVVVVGLLIAWFSGNIPLPTADPPDPTQTILPELSETPENTALPTLTQTPAFTETPAATPTPELGIGSSWVRPADEMTMLYVPAGEFEMGSNDGEKDEKPVHTVFMDTYWIDQTEVTSAMYTKCWQEKVCNIPTNDQYFRSYEYRNHPVVYITWEDANTYCEWTGSRLPTEAEWEKAAQGNSNGTYPWGSVINKTYANYHGNEGNTQPVGVYSRSQNVYGLDDMAGNVWEFTADWYSSDYYSNSPSKNPTGPAQGGEGDRRVARGGSWGSTAEDLRVYNRHSFDPTSTGNAVGFRCARDADLVTQE